MTVVGKNYSNFSMKTFWFGLTKSVQWLSNSEKIVTSRAVLDEDGGDETVYAEP